ncbi:NAD(P)/FAD-dependent oxidoreductase [Rhizobium sp. WYJ-E13]|uniref:FAD-dependent oxidoreductase n=1 Tax=Rhizobium sp. WYJ-E13 TaxID=2849093 RepID=UPI0020A6F19E|nr:NAD(P)/FAD-dependent oxidoreductase [Rhizobium sp. WYJ-E13]
MQEPLSAQDMSSPDAAKAARSRLLRLERQVRRDLGMIEAAPRAWVPTHDEADVSHDVIIVGAGLSGLTIAFGLKRQGVERVSLIDAAPAGQEGPWVTTARMRTLRSPKTLSGPDLGVPSLTYRAWHEALHGRNSFDRLDRIDRIAWMNYLSWFRTVLALNVENDSRLLSIDEERDHLRLRVLQGGRERTMSCRKVVLATGLEGAGGLHVPALIRHGLPRERWTHSGEPILAQSLAGKRIGVIGAAASSFDWAVTALEAGADSVTLLARAPSLPKTELLDWSNFPGFLNHFSDLDDESRYRFTRRMFAFRTPPTMEMYERAMAFPRCRLVSGAAIEAVGIECGEIAVKTTVGDFAFDHLLLGTGYRIDLAHRPELAGFSGLIATWADRFAPPKGEVDLDLLAYPYLGPAFELVEKVPGTASMLANIHIFNNAAVPSLGPVCNGITGLKAGVPKLVAGICRGLFMGNIDYFFRSLDGYDKVHFQPNIGP